MASSASSSDDARLGEEMNVTSIENDFCLIPGNVVVRVDKAPGNARRIYTGVDIRADVETVWKLLVDYERLADVVPNLVANELISLDPAGRGARLRQVGSAQVLPGLNFRATMVLDVKELREGLDPRSLRGGASGGPNGVVDSEALRLAEAQMPLERGVFPRPWAACEEATMMRDITMQSVPGEAGDFTLYQGLWRMQTVPLCNGATRLTFAVEIQPRPWLPVALVESRIANDLVTNLKAVHDEATLREEALKRAAVKSREAVKPPAPPTADDDDVVVATVPPPVTTAPSRSPVRSPAAAVAQARLEEEDVKRALPALRERSDTEQLERLREVLVQSIGAITTGLPGGLGATSTEVRRVRLAADRLGERYRLRREVRRFDAVANSGRWRVIFSSAIAEALAEPTEPPRFKQLGSRGTGTMRAASPSSRSSSSSSSNRGETQTEMGLVKAFLRTFPRLSTLASRFALRSIELDVRPSASGDHLDTIVALRNRAQPFPAPALRLEHSLIAAKGDSDAAMIQDRVRLEPASGRLRLLPRPALPLNLLSPEPRQRLTSFDVLYNDADLLVTLSTDGDLRVATKQQPLGGGGQGSPPSPPSSPF